MRGLPAPVLGSVEVTASARGGHGSAMGGGGVLSLLVFAGVVLQIHGVRD